jgi:hypothetical protein
LELIQRLQADKLFESFVLVGGTSLALQIGHRISIDIDLFSDLSFDAQFYLEYLEKEYSFSMQYMHTNTLKGIINGAFVDFITHSYPNLKEPIYTEGIRLLSKPDIAAMKVNAISGNGTRSKDFVDIYFLLKEYSFKDVIDFYGAKYGGRNEFHALKSMTYFDDVNEEDWPNLILEPNLTLAVMKKEITKRRDEYLKEE